MDLRLLGGNEARKKALYSIVINVYCTYQRLEENINIIKSKLEPFTKQKGFDIIIKPCYLLEDTKVLLAKKN